jgi:hypothetical protein
MNVLRPKRKHSFPPVLVITKRRNHQLEDDFLQCLGAVDSSKQRTTERLPCRLVLALALAPAAAATGRPLLALVLAVAPAALAAATGLPLPALALALAPAASACSSHER